MKNPIVKKIVGLIAGFIVFFVVTMLCESASSTAYPAPIGLSPTDVNGMNAFIKSLPIPALLMLVAGYAIGAFMGGFTAVFISKNNLSIAIILGLGLLVATILNLMAFEHPLWVAIASCVVVLLFAWLGGRYALYNYVLPNQHKQ